MAKMHVKKGDKVVVLSGKDKGKEGEILRAKPAEGKVIVEGVAMVKKAVRPNAQNQQGGIIEQEAAIDASNVMLICPSCGKPTRVGHDVNDEGKKVRVCKKCGASSKGLSRISFRGAPGFPTRGALRETSLRKSGGSSHAVSGSGP